MEADNIDGKKEPKRLPVWACISLFIVVLFIFIGLYGTLVSGGLSLVLGVEARHPGVVGYIFVEASMLLAVLTAAVILLRLERRPFSDLGLSLKGHASGLWYGLLMAILLYLLGFGISVVLGEIEVTGFQFKPLDLLANALGVNLGTMIMVGIPTALICMLVSGIIWGGFIGNKIFTELPANVGEIKDDGKELPSFGLVLGVILIPLVLILLSTLSKYMPLPAGVQDVLGFLGKPFLALTIATLAAMYFLGIRRGFSGAQLKKILDHSLRPVGMILLVIASGGVIRWMLQDSGLGNIIGPALEKSGLPLILIAFFIAILVRASVGSSIVAMTMASGIMATMPAVMDTSMLYRATMCCAICGGATALSHVNDAGFWLVGTFLEIDEKTTLKSWTIMETLIGVTALIVSLVISIFA